MNEEIYLTDEFLALEKLQWKKWSRPQMHEYIDELDLKLFRSLLVDER